KLSSVLSLSLLFLLCTTSLAAQRRAEDRREFLRPSTRTTDDPRRIPLPPLKPGPQPVLVLTGGRIFDGTGASIRRGTVVIEGNHISAILPPESKGWPANAQVIDVSGKTVLPGLIDMHTHLTKSEPGTSQSLAADPAENTLIAAE